jgi:hypothetical protein
MGAIERSRGDDSERARRRAQLTLGAAAQRGSVAQRLPSFARRGELQLEEIAPAELLASIGEVPGHTLEAAIAVCIAGTEVAGFLETAFRCR